MGRSVNKEYAKRNRSTINTKLKRLLRRIVTENSQRCGLRSDMNLNRDSVWVWLKDNYGLIFYVSLLRMNCGTASIDDRFNRLRGVFSRGREWNGSGSIREDKEIYRDKWDVLAYILYYFYENHPKMMYILLEGLKRGIKLIPENEVVEILDFGTGPGTVLASICDFISNAKEAGIVFV